MNASTDNGLLSPRLAVAVFLVFAGTYFLSALVRAIAATLSPTLSAEMSLTPGDLGLLAGGYFFGFALTQLPMGRWLDHHGPKRVVLAFLAMAVAGCVAFALAGSFVGLLAARVLTGMGLSACLMAPLTGFRRWLSPAAQLRANSWMLMTGSMGMVASTLPVQWLLPVIGWRGLFWALAALFVLAIAVLAWSVPAWKPAAGVPAPAAGGPDAGYAHIWRHPYFRTMVPVGFINYGGMVAVQALWAGPWMVNVAGYTPEQAAAGLFAINLSMLLAFWTWGVVNPHLARRGIRPESLIGWGLPLSLAVIVAIAWLGPRAGWGLWALFCVGSTFVSLSQPAVALALPPQAAGRALSAYNLVIFGGVFMLQWGIGLAIDALSVFGWSEPDRYRGAVGLFALCCVGAYAVFWRGWRRIERDRAATLRA
ncbi:MULTISPECIES: MFS transporter [Hydrogenophaga]|uniref:Major facilitator superfamily transporter n=1 Tax=Hydrogenophaga intermedia TaxID=65786 RepID=A0A1L1PHF5_HYDIT|nr:MULTISPECIES: MFS transporter [Hydrogenophaga]AOS81950.1 MFS transporter [Hydrogenophaga sp. PBC]TMU78407.1 MFS transporter [Hydrogenophaga intermedia]CDN89378.1 Major facilitator superfamily transporter [Hydrogenophaga intermedia]